MKEIPLTHGKVATVDDADYEWLMQWKWFSHKPGGTCYYAVRDEPGSKKRIYMHRLILGMLQTKQKVDHRNGDGLDNQRHNLRSATQSQNGANRGPQINNTSGFKGVALNKPTGKWCARIKAHQVNIHLGLFENLVDALEAYNRAALKHFGEFALLNPI